METMRDHQIAGAGIALLVIGSFGTWVKIADVVSSGGMDHDGPITLGLAVVAAVVVALAFRKQAAPNKIALAICGVLALVVSIVDIVDVNGGDGDLINASVGWGLWLTLVGSIVLTAAAAMQFRKR